MATEGVTLNIQVKVTGLRALKFVIGELLNLDWFECCSPVCFYISDISEDHCPECGCAMRAS